MNVRIFLTLLIVVQLLLSSNISVLTYNIHALSPIIAGDDPHSRIIKILDNSQSYDLIFMQENWIFQHSDLKSKLPNHNLIISNESKFVWPLSTWINSNGSGLTIAISDKYEIIDSHEEKFNTCSGWLSKANDCLSSKGFQHIKIKVNNQRIDIYNTHLDAGNSSVDIATREKQISHIVNYILENSINHPLILSGDLNINQLDINENKTIEGLVNKLEMNIVDWPSKNPYEREVLDYILYRGLNLDENKFGVNATLLGLSDHPPIEANFTIKKVD